MPLLDKIQKDMIAAMKAKDEAHLNATRLIKTALKKHEVDTGKPLDEAAEINILTTLRKQRLDAMEMFKKGGRDDLFEKESADLKHIESYLPGPATGEEIESAIEAALAETGATSAKQMGLVMKLCKEKLAGKMVDGKTLAETVRARLG